MAQGNKGNTGATATVATVAFNATAPAAVQALKRPSSARGKTVALAQAYAGKPLAAFKAAWEKQAAQAGGIHHNESVFTLGTSKSKRQHQAFSGWLSWLVRNGIVTVKQ